jgi:MoaA/NifB/PqqE/SkfB family radical SAM enzyme
VRRSYAETISAALFRGNAGGLRRAAGLSTKVLLARIRPGLCPPLLPPILATVVVTERCNLDCSFCTTHGRNRKGNETDRLMHTIDGVASLGADAVGFTGGEPLLLPTFEEAAARAARRGLYTHLNTNGTLIDATRAVRLLECGLGSINISVDGAENTLHDRFRGPGAFEKALAGARNLVAARRLTGAATRIRFVMALNGRNAHEATAIPELGRRTGVDGCSFIPIHQESDSTASISPPVAREPGAASSASPAAARAAAALAAGSSREVVDNSRAYLLGMRSFFEGAAMPRRCSALRTSLVIGPDERAYPCVPAYSFGWSAGLPTAGKSLGKIFKSGALDDTLNREYCSQCWWNCHRELDIALGIL